jgi:hypothetical protein
MFGTWSGFNLESHYDAEINKGQIKGKIRYRLAFGGFFRWN